jgi:FixJ family two-component response regulator
LCPLGWFKVEPRPRHLRIAARLGVSLQTVKLHRGRLMRKLQLHSVAELVRLAEKAWSLLPSH